MAYTRTWNAAYEADPADTDQASGGALDIRSSKTDIRERLEKDHYFDIAGTDADHGEHKKVTLRVQAADPSNVADKGFLYLKDVSAKVELFWEDEDGNVRQVTSAGKLLLDAGLADTIAEKTAGSGVTVDGVKPHYLSA